MTRIVSVLTHPLIRMDLPRPWGPNVGEFALISCEVTSSDGTQGVGFSWVPGVGATAVRSLLDDDLSALAVGHCDDPETTWDALWGRLRELGGGGVTTLALAALDIGLWDLSARRTGRSLVAHLGRRHESVEVYGSGVNRHYSISELRAQARRLVATGRRGVKIKVGGRDLATDIERVAAVREAIGPDGLLMIDANQLWDLPSAERSISALSRFGLHWVEEPLPADDFAGYAQLRSRVDVPIACGESLYTVQSFRDLLAGGGADIVQPNVVRVGGVTPFLRIAALAEGFGAALAPHLLPEISGQLALCLPEPTLVEDVEDTTFASLGALSAPSGIEIHGSRLMADTPPGHGLRFANTAHAPRETESV